MIKKLVPRLMTYAFAMLSVWLGVAPAAHAALDINFQSNYVVWFGGNCGASGSSGGSSTSVQLAGKDNVEKLLNYLQSKGFSLEQATGIVGAMQAESGQNLNPTAENPSGAYGIAQWLGGRRSNLEALGAQTDFNKQVQYLGIELGLEQPPAGSGITGGSEKGAVDAVKATNTPEAAALAWENAFERSGGAALDARQANAKKLFTSYSGGGTGAGAMSATDVSSSSGGSSSCASGSATGAVDADGYSFPIALGKSEVTNGYAWPCPGSCHHDGTPAFDLSKNARDDSTEGTPALAIYNGTIQSFDNSYAGITGCQAFQLVGDDGWWYWYGHQQNATVQNGTKVHSGQQVSSVGRRACTGNGSYPHLHIDRGSPKGHYGGTVCCRDPGFTPLMNKLYDELGGAPSVL